MLNLPICGRNYYENLIPASPTDANVFLMLMLLLLLLLMLMLILHFTISCRNYYENLIPASPTDHMELKEGSNEDEDFDDQEEDQVKILTKVEECYKRIRQDKNVKPGSESKRGPGNERESKRNNIRKAK